MTKTISLESATKTQDYITQMAKFATKKEMKSALLILTTILFLSSLVSCQTINRQNPIAQEAKSRIGSYYKKGLSKQCANFVSDVLSKKGINVNYSFAQDFRKVGQKVVEKPQNGDILLFAGTYNGPNYITHVGIYYDGYVIHRPTFNGLVIKEPLPNRLINHLVEIRRL